MRDQPLGAVPPTDQTPTSSTPRAPQTAASKVEEAATGEFDASSVTSDTRTAPMAPIPLPRPAPPPPPPPGVGPTPAAGTFIPGLVTTSTGGGGPPFDGLSATSRRLLAGAAVLGEVFWFSGLRSLQLVDGLDIGPRAATSGVLDTAAVDAALNGRLVRLQQARVIVLVEQSSLPGDVEFAFAHPSYAPALLATLERPDRERLHRAAAFWMERLPAGARSPWLERRARHLEEGGRPEAASRLLVAVADEQTAAGRLDQAVATLTRAVELIGLDAAPELADAQIDRLQLLLRMGRLEEAAAAIGVALRASLVANDRTRAGRALVCAAFDDLARFGVYRAGERLEEARALLVTVSDGVGLAAADRVEGYLLLARCGSGDVARAIQVLERAINPAPELPGIVRARARAEALPYLAEARIAAGETEVAEALLREAADRSVTLGMPIVGAHTERLQGDLAWARGRELVAIERWERALVRTKELGLRPETVRLEVRLGESDLARAQRSRARDRLGRAMTEADALAIPEQRAEALRAWSRISDTDAIRRINQATELTDRFGLGRALAECALTRAEILITIGSPASREAGVQVLRRAAEKLESAGHVALLVRVLCRLAGQLPPPEGPVFKARADALTARIRQ